MKFNGFTGNHSKVLFIDESEIVKVNHSRSLPKYRCIICGRNTSYNSGVCSGCRKCLNLTVFVFRKVGMIFEDVPQ